MNIAIFGASGATGTLLTQRCSGARGEYRIDADAHPRNGSCISRADVADFMMQQIGNPQWIKRCVYIA
jgi:putative NADH-flavin reductase